MTKEENLLIKIQGLLFFSTSIASVFLNLFLFTLGGFSSIVKFNLASLSLLFILYILSAFSLKRTTTKNLIRISLLFYSLLYLLLFFLKDKSVNYVFLLGVIQGIGHGFFWPGNNLSQYILTHKKTRNHYFGRLNFLLNIALSFGPIIGGSIITFFAVNSSKEVGYTTIFLIVGILIWIIFLFSSKLPEHTGIKFSFHHIIKNKRGLDWKIVLLQQFLTGLWDVTFSAFFSVLIFLIVKQEILVGAINTIDGFIYAIFSITASFILQKYSNFSFIGAIIGSIGILFFAFFQNWFGILFFVILANSSLPFLNIAISKSMYDVIDSKEGEWQEKYQYFIERDSVLGVARIMNYLILLFLFMNGNQIEIAKKWLFIIPIFPFLIGFLQYYQNKKSSKV